MLQMQMQQRMQWRAHSWAPYALTRLPLVRQGSTRREMSTDLHFRA